MSSSPADFLFFMFWIILINSVYVISKNTIESFRFVILLLVCGVFLSSMSLQAVSMKGLLNILLNWQGRVFLRGTLDAVGKRLVGRQISLGSG
jgi:hypothetical protein